MAYTLKHQKVHWEVDLEAHVLIGRTQLEIEVIGDEPLTELRLNCRQCKVSVARMHISVHLQILSQALFAMCGLACTCINFGIVACEVVA